MELLRTLRPVVASAACAALVPGCSMFFVESPPAQHVPGQPVSCTRGQAAPIIDSVVAGLQVVRVGYAISQTEADYEDFPISRGADIGLGLGLTALFAASAAYGFSSTSTCAAVERSAMAAPPAAPALGAGGQPVMPMPGDACVYDAQCPGEERCHEGACVPRS